MPSSSTVYLGTVICVDDEFPDTCLNDQGCGPWENNNGTCKLTAFKFIVEEDRKDKSKECGDADSRQQSTQGVFSTMAKTGLLVTLRKFPIRRSFDQTSFADVA